MNILDKIFGRGSKRDYGSLQNGKANKILKGLLTYGLCHPKMNGMDTGILVALKEYEWEDVIVAIETYCRIKGINHKSHDIEDFLDDVDEYMQK